MRVSHRAIHFTASLEFAFPTVPNWSIGFIYHNGGPGGGQAHTYIFQEGGRLNAWHITWDGSEISHYTLPESIRPSQINDQYGEINRLSIRVNEDGAQLVVNGWIVLTVPSSLLVPKTGSSMLCVGMGTDEGESYSIPYFNFKVKRLSDE